MIAVARSDAGYGTDRVWPRVDGSHRPPLPGRSVLRARCRYCTAPSHFAISAASSSGEQVKAGHGAVSDAECLHIGTLRVASVR